MGLFGDERRCLGVTRSSRKTALLQRVVRWAASRLVCRDLRQDWQGQHKREPRPFGSRVHL